MTGACDDASAIDTVAVTDTAGWVGSAGRRPGPVRTALVCCLVAAAGAVSSLLIVTLAMLAWLGRVEFAWQGVAAVVAGHLALAAWCLHVVRQRRCGLERRLYMAPTMGVVSVMVTVLVFGAAVGSWADGILVMLWFTVFTGYPVWTIVYAGLALWVLCRRAGHPHGRARAMPGAEGEGARA